MSKSQLRCFILSTQTYVNIGYINPRCLHSFSLPVSSSTFHFPFPACWHARSSAVKRDQDCGGEVELQCQHEQEMEEKVVVQCISLSCCHIVSAVGWQFTFTVMNDSFRRSPVKVGAITIKINSESFCAR